MLDLSLAQRIACSFAEKEELIPQVKEILELAMYIRKKGLLALEEFVLDEACDFPFLLRYALGLVVDGAEAEEITHLVNAYITADNPTGAQLLHKVIIREGALLLRDEMSPSFIVRSLMAWLGEDICRKYHPDQIAEEARASFESGRGNDLFVVLPCHLEQLVQAVGRFLISSYDLAAALEKLSHQEASLCLMLMGLADAAASAALLDTLPRELQNKVKAADLSGASMKDAAQAVTNLALVLLGQDCGVKGGPDLAR